MTCAVRFLYSFARDGGLPFSSFFAMVEPRTGACALLALCARRRRRLHPAGPACLPQK